MLSKVHSLAIIPSPQYQEVAGSHSSDDQDRQSDFQKETSGSGTTDTPASTLSELRYERSTQSPTNLSPRESGQSSAEPKTSTQHQQEQLFSRNRRKHNRNLKCPACPKVLPRKCDFNKHVKTHDRAFKCEIAGCLHKLGFALKKDLRRHINTVHRKSTFTCHVPGCGKVFSRSDNCDRHFEERHRDNSSGPNSEQDGLAQIDSVQFDTMR